MKQIKYIIFHIHINSSIVENIRSQHVLIQLKYYFCAISRAKREISEKWTHLIINNMKEKNTEKARAQSPTLCRQILPCSWKATWKDKYQFQRIRKLRYFTRSFFLSVSNLCFVLFCFVVDFCLWTTFFLGGGLISALPEGAGDMLLVLTGRSLPGCELEFWSLSRTDFSSVSYKPFSAVGY